jgi:hypothetical protein
MRFPSPVEIRSLGVLVVLCLELAGPTNAEDPAGFDLDADGIVDRWVEMDAGDDRFRDHDGDGLIEWSAGAPRNPSDPRALPDIAFELVWNTGATLNTLWRTATGDANLNGVLDFAGGSFSPNVIHLFESLGAGAYAEIWNSSAVTPPAVYKDIAFADTDRDGLGEILGAEGSTLGKIMLFEEWNDTFTFVTDAVRESDFSGNRRLQTVLTGDTDLDGNEEIIVVAGGSSPTDGLVSIWEHDGTVGDNSYTKVYEYTTVSYVFGAGFGDADNDGYPEIILGLGGWGGYPLIIRRIEYDWQTGTWVHHQFTASVLGLPLTPHVADLDEDGDNELAYGSSGYVAIFENTGENSFAVRDSFPEPLAGTVLSVDSYPLNNETTMSIAAGSFEGDIRIWSYDAPADTFDLVYSHLGVGGAIRDLALVDDEEDGREELIPSISSGVSQMRVYRRTDTSDAPENAPVLITEPAISATNPFRPHARFRTRERTGRLTIHDMQGRILRVLPVRGGSAVWDGYDARGVAATSGRYLVRWQGARDGLAITLIR